MSNWAPTTEDDEIFGPPPRGFRLKPEKVEPTPLGLAVFKADPGLPVRTVPSVRIGSVISPAPPSSAIPASLASEHDSSRELDAREAAELRCPPGQPGSGTRLWGNAPRLLGTGSFADSSEPRFTVGEASICDIQYLAIDGETIEAATVAAPDGFELSDDLPRRLPYISGACQRSIGVGTTLRLQDVVDDSPRGRLLQREPYLKSRNLVSRAPVAQSTYEADWRYYDQYNPHTGLRTCSDARFCTVSSPTRRPRLRSPDFVSRRWPNSYCYATTDNADPLDDAENEAWFVRFNDDAFRTSFRSYQDDVAAASAHFRDAGGRLVRLPATCLVVLPAFCRNRFGLLDDPIECGTWINLCNRGLTGDSTCDRRDFGKSLTTLGSSTLLDRRLGTGILFDMLKASENYNEHYHFDRVRELLQPLLQFHRWFDPRSDSFRWDMLQLHPANDGLHWGYPCWEGAGSNPLFAQSQDRAPSFQIADAVFTAARFPSMYPKQCDREDIRLLLGLESRSDETGLTYLLTPMDLYQIQQTIQIRPYTLRPEDPKCENGRERLRVIRPGNWTTQCTDVDAHGLGVTEFACVGLSVLTAEFALHPTVLGYDSTPCFFFDHQARMHDGLVLSGGSGGKKKYWQFFVSLVCGAKATASKSDLWSPERVQVLQPEASHYYDWLTGERFPPVANYENWRPHSVPVSPYQNQLSRRLPGGKFEPVQHVGLPDVHVEELNGTDSTSRTLLSVPARVPVVPFEGKIFAQRTFTVLVALCAGFLAFMKAIYRSRSTDRSTSCRFHPDLLPASWHEWRRNGRHVAYYGGTEEDIVRTFSRLLDEVERDDHGAFRVARAFGHHQEVKGQLVNPVQPQSVHFGWKLSFRRGSTTAVCRSGSQVYKDCKLDEYGEPVGVPFSELARLRSLADAALSGELPTPECVSDELLSSPLSKRSRPAGDDEA
ncbi:unnamed protein product [Oikopleura dioica]|uniref:Uncharacterized protein n=1 Tax=Oikopleura dioica TaxID=34765 RepID=E4XCI0_OIKDI|nr:unnamed protein product [Oikopleura dioica]